MWLYLTLGPLTSFKFQKCLMRLEAFKNGIAGSTHLGNIFKRCKYNIEGTSYRDPYENNLPKLWFLSKEYQSIMRSRLDLTDSKLRELDPSYTAPTVEVKKEESCFVTTATMGDTDHSTIHFMRCFCDKWLIKRKWGKESIDLYYIYGPVAAHFIGQSQ